jgi:hypothetical protein
MNACIVRANEQQPLAAPRSLGADDYHELLPLGDFANSLLACHQHLLSYWLGVLRDE